MHRNRGNETEDAKYFGPCILQMGNLVFLFFILHVVPASLNLVIPIDFAPNNDETPSPYSKIDFISSVSIDNAQWGTHDEQIAVIEREDGEWIVTIEKEYARCAKK